MLLFTSLVLLFSFSSSFLGLSGEEEEEAFPSCTGPLNFENEERAASNYPYLAAFHENDRRISHLFADKSAYDAWPSARQTYDSLLYHQSLNKRGRTNRFTVTSHSSPTDLTGCE